MKKISLKALENKLDKVLSEKFVRTPWGEVSLITKNIILLTHFNAYALCPAQEFLKEYGYELEGGNSIDRVVVFKKCM